MVAVDARRLTLRCCSQMLTTSASRPRGVRGSLKVRSERPARVHGGVCCKTRASGSELHARHVHAHHSVCEDSVDVSDRWVPV